MNSNVNTQTQDMKVLLLVLVISLSPVYGLLPSSVGPETLNQTVVFQKGELGYFCFRIPVLHLTSNNTVLAFAEGRGQHTKSCGDHGDVHIVLKSSMDYGLTWSNLTIVHKEDSHTIGNPAPVEDKASGKIVLLFSRDNQEILQLESTDDGLTWGSMTDITTMVKPSDFTFVASGPSDGLQLPSGRFIIYTQTEHFTDIAPTIGMYGFTKGFGGGPGSYAIYSDDMGKTWIQSPPTSDVTTGECQIVPLDLYSKPDAKNTKLMMYMRTSHAVRTFGYSNDSGASWHNLTAPKSLSPETSVQGAILAITYVGVTYNTHLYVSQPHSVVRTNMTIFHSTDGGHTWQDAYQLWKGPSGYSSMILHQGAPMVYCLYEKGNVEYWETLTFAAFSPLI